ncbi:transcription termination/antitermination protein NusA [Dubosiella muris]|uniref:Transcription termination/antitermination protein NusA n=1 Tax=Dubosiella muris TaxID=3038133 RepID=A0AC61R8P6_9FIRM|nr:transcription termination/antitermination protein NusA [Dubosiella muris]
MKVESLANALQGIESNHQLDPAIVEDALKEALTKAYQKQMKAHSKQTELRDVQVKVEIVNGIVHIYQVREVMNDDDITDDELEISLEEAKAIDPRAQIGDTIDEEVDFTQFDRAAVLLAKNVMKQKIREAEKQQVYEEYCDKVNEMVSGVVETVENKFIIVDIGKTYAIMKKGDQIPTEQYTEGQRLNVVITEVNKETKGAQVAVSRATPVFVRRLFEKEVPEIYNGIIEIKAIARDPGERCKIAVLSHNENIDPIGACIGPRGARVQAIINELNGEKIDIFEWSDNIATLIANALSPSEGIAVIPNDKVKDGLIVVVPDNQLSLAIGKRGKNARLAVKLSNHKIDIKSQSEMEELGIDYMAIAAQMQEEYEAKKAAERAYKQQEKIKALKENQEEIEDVNIADFDFGEDEDDSEPMIESLYATEEENLQAAQEGEKVVDEMEEAARLAKEMRKANQEHAVKEYTSKFEKLADASKKEEIQTPKKEKTLGELIEEKEEKAPVAKKKPDFDAMKPIYSDEELAEIEEDEMEDNIWDDDVDYEQYDEYYDD